VYDNETFFYSRLTPLNLKARLKRESLTPEEIRQNKSTDLTGIVEFSRSISFHRLLSLLLVFAFMFTMLPILPAKTAAFTEPGEIELTKTAVPVSDDPDNREFDVTLTVSGSALVTKVPVDVVLVLDTSGSMDYGIEGSDDSRLDVVKSAAKTFAEDILTDNDQARVAVVKYAGDTDSTDYIRRDNITITYDDPYDDAGIVSNFSNNISNIRSSINGLDADGGTNIEAGFYQANQILTDNGRTNAEKVVVLMTDGEPTFAYTYGNIELEAGYYTGYWPNRTWHPGTYENTYGITYGHGNAYDAEYKDKAIAEAFAIKSAHDAKIFTVGLTASADMADNIRAVLNPTGTNKYQEQYFEANNPDAISEAFAEISNQINAVANNTVIVDIINEDFELVDGTAGDATIDGQKLTWEIGDVYDEDKSVTFRVRAKDNVYGAANTNAAAYLYFDTPDANSYYDADEFDNPDASIDREKRLIFEKPVVEVPPIAANDDFYQVRVGTTLEADATNESVLYNDLSKKMQTIAGWTTTKVIAVRTSDPSQGDVTEFNDDGTFTYVSDTGSSGTDSFTYDIVTTVQHGSGAVRELKDSATVTITILPAYALSVVYEDQVSGDILTPAVDPNLGLAYLAGETYTVAIADIDNYDYVGPKPGSALTGSMPESDLTVTLLYEKTTVDSTIEYYIDGEYSSTEAGPSGKWGSSQTLSAAEISKHQPVGYGVNGDPSDYKLTLSVDEAENVYKIFYTKNSYPVSVEYYYRNNLDTPFATNSLGTKTFGTKIDDVSDAVHTIIGAFVRDEDKSNLPFTVGIENNVIVIVYESVPNAVDDSESTSANIPVSIDVLDNDSDPLEDTVYIDGIVSGPSHGTVELINGEYVYTPATDYEGTDSFVYRIRDDYGQTDEATVTIAISPWNLLTVHYKDVQTGEKLLTTYSEMFPEGAALSISQPDITGFTKLGTEGGVNVPTVMPGNNVTITYLYNRNSYEYTINYYYEFSGEKIETITGNAAPFESTILDVSDSAQIDISVYDRFDTVGLPLTIGVDETENVIDIYYAAKPQAEADTKTINPKQIVTIDVLANDTDADGGNDNLTIKSVAQPAAGQGTTSVDPNTGIVTYTPDGSLSDTEVTFGYTIEDAQGLTSTAIVTIKIRPYYNLTVKYVETSDTANIIGGQPAVEKMYGEEYSIIAPMTVSGYVFDMTVGQNLTGNMPQSDHEVVVYYRRANINYTVEYYYENSNEFIDSASFSALFESTVEASEIANYSSLPEGYTRYRVVFPNDADDLTISDDPEANIVKVYYSAAPVSENDTITINPNQTIEIPVLSNDSDDDGKAGELIIQSIDTTTIAGFAGSATVTGDKITYTPAADAENKTVSFKYTIIDAQEQTAEATVTVTIRSFYTLRVFYREVSNDSVELAGSEQTDKLVKGQSYDALVKDIDGYAPTGVIESRPLTGYGLTGEMPDSDLDIIVRYAKVPVGSTINYSYYVDGVETPLSTEAGPTATWGTEVQLTQTQIDAYLSGELAIPDSYYSPGEPADYKLTLAMDETENVFSVVYKSVPEADDNYAEVDLLESVTVGVLTNDDDADGDDLTVINIVDGSGPLYGDAVINENGTITYTHTSQLDFGSDEFEYTIADEDGNETTATVYIYIHPHYPLSLNLVDIDTGMLIDTAPNPWMLTLKRGTEHLIRGEDHQIPGFTYLGIVPANDEQYAAYAADISIFADDITVAADERLIPEDLDIETLLPQETITMREGGLSRTLVYQRANIGYTVEYYFTRNGEEPFATWQNEALFESVVDSWPLPTDDDVVYTDPEAEPIDLDVFEESYSDGSPLTIAADPEDNVIRVYYAAYPTAEDDNDTTSMNEPVTIDVLANDSDPLGGDLTIVDVEDPDDAEVTINENGTITVTPDEDFTGTIVFEYTVINEEEHAATATVTVTVAAPEPTPIPTLPTIEVTETIIPLAEPTPTLPTIEVAEESVPLAEPTVPTIAVVQEEIPKSGENAPLWPIGLALLTLAGGLTLILRRRSSDDTMEQDD
jgi:uncharacterized protein YegL